MEILSYSFLSSEDEEKIKNFLDDITIIGINKRIKDLAIKLRKSYKLKLPDSIIAATAINTKSILLTNDKQFSNIRELKYQSVILK